MQVEDQVIALTLVDRPIDADSQAHRFGRDRRLRDGALLTRSPFHGTNTPTATRRAHTAFALAGLLALLPWGFFTLVEIDRGWEDAIWQAEPWRTFAIALTAVGAIAAVAALLAALSLNRRLVWAALALEATAAAAWVVLLFVTPA
jgi:hypothetical protein